MASRISDSFIMRPLLSFAAVFEEREHTLQDDEEAQQCGGGNVGPTGQQLAVGGHQGVDGTCNQHAEQRADHIAHAAGQQGAADDGGGDGVHFKAAGLLHRAGHGVQAVADTADGAQKGREDVGFHFRALDIQAHHDGGAFTSADSVQRAAKFGVLQHKKNDDDYQQRDDNGGADIGNLKFSLAVGISQKCRQINFLVSPGIEGCIGILRNGNLIGADHSRHTAGKEHACHRDDERLDFHIADQISLHRTKHHSDQKHDDQKRNTGPALYTHAVGQNHTIHSDQGPDGDVDPAGKHDAGHPAGNTNEACVGNQQIQKGLHMREALVCIDHAADGIHDHKQDDGDQQQQRIAVHRTSGLGETNFGFHFAAISFLSADSAALAASLRAERVCSHALKTGACTTTMITTMMALMTGA
ncbi:hypothetical protein SDC9_112256 [bioreactor metagenome]|uniref:Uncharacterized protein n=1 Tax=bioreactor metagenome TaxID=1076179 RepID=A0A645BLE4_9ZZZZ